MKPNRKLQKSMVRIFRARWRETLRLIQKGEPLAELYDAAFEADTPRRRRHLAKQFYSAEHAKQMIKSTDTQILQNLSAVHHILNDNCADLEEQRIWRIVESDSRLDKDFLVRTLRPELMISY